MLEAEGAGARLRRSNKNKGAARAPIQSSARAGVTDKSEVSVMATGHHAHKRHHLLESMSGSRSARRQQAQRKLRSQVDDLRGAACVEQVKQVFARRLDRDSAGLDQ
jgi:hypothetical protein